MPLGILVFLLLVPIVVAMAIRGIVRRVWQEHGNRNLRCGLNATQAAEAFFEAANLPGIQVVEHDSWVTDYYDSSSRKLLLSPKTARSHSMAAVALALHESGHALQQACRFGPFPGRVAAIGGIKLGTGLVPLFMGLLMITGRFPFRFALLGTALAWFGFFLLALMTQSVETDANRRVFPYLRQLHLVRNSEEYETMCSCMQVFAWIPMTIFLSIPQNFLSSIAPKRFTKKKTKKTKEKISQKDQKS